MSLHCCGPWLGGVQIKDCWFGDGWLNGGWLKVVDTEVIILEVADLAVVGSWLGVGEDVAWHACCTMAWLDRTVLWRVVAWHGFTARR